MPPERHKVTTRTTTPPYPMKGNRESRGKKAQTPYSDSTPTQIPPPFRFLDLPKEIRLMVYERLPRQIKHTYISTKYRDNGAIIVTKHLPLALLQTCRTIYAEAESIIKKLIQSFILESNPKLIMACERTTSFLLDEASSEFNALRASLKQNAGNLKTIAEHFSDDETQTSLFGGGANIHRFFRQAALVAASKVRPPHDLMSSKRVEVDIVSVHGSSMSMEEAMCSNKIKFLVLTLMVSHYRVRNSGMILDPRLVEYAPSRDIVPQDMAHGEQQYKRTMTKEIWDGEWLPS